MSIRLDHTGGVIGLKGASSGSIVQFVIPKTGVAGQALAINSLSSGVATLSFIDAGLPTGGVSGQLIRRTSGGYEWFDAALLPSGGTNGQLLRRTSVGYEWFSQVPITGLPVGGAAGQALVKTSSADYAASWQTISGGGGEPLGLSSGSTLDCGDLVSASTGAANFGSISEFLSTVWC